MHGKRPIGRMAGHISIFEEAVRMTTESRCRILAFLLGLLLVGCGSGSDPASIVRGFIEAGKAGDRDRAMTYLLESERQFTNVIVEESPELRYEIGRVLRDGERRIVPVTIVEGGDSLDLEFVVVREGDTWRITMDATLERKKDSLLEEMRGRREAIDGVMPSGD